jgi:hypothetical protein
VGEALFFGGRVPTISVVSCLLASWRHMTRTLLLATVLAAQLCAGTIPCAVPTFTWGHMTISNCQSSVTNTIPAEQLEGVFPYGLQPEPLFTTGNQLAFYHSGGATAVSGAEVGYFDASLTADFTMDPGWAADLVNWTCMVGFDGVTASAGCELTFAGPAGTGVPLQSGTITLLEQLHVDAICDTCILHTRDTGTVGGGLIIISQNPVTAPEPSTFVLIGFGIVGVCLRMRAQER